MASRTMPKKDVSIRKGYSGGTDIYTRYSEKKGFKTPYESALEYKGEYKDELTEEKKKLFRNGHWIEEFIGKHFFDLYGYRVKHVARTYVCQEDRRIVCDPDYIVVGSNRIAVECKASGDFNRMGFGEGEGPEDVPPQYLFQCYAYFLCGVCTDEVWLVKFSNNDFKKYVIPNPGKNALSRIRVKVSEWMDKVDSGWMPDPANLEETKMVYPADSLDEKTTSVADADTESDIEEYLFWSKKEKEAKEQKDAYQQKLIAYMGGANILINDKGKKLATYSRQIRNEYVVKASESMVLRVSNKEK